MTTALLYALAQLLAELCAKIATIVMAKLSVIDSAVPKYRDTRGCTKTGVRRNTGKVKLTNQDHCYKVSHSNYGPNNTSTVYNPRNVDIKESEEGFSFGAGHDITHRDLKSLRLENDPPSPNDNSSSNLNAIAKNPTFVRSTDFDQNPSMQCPGRPPWNRVVGSQKSGGCIGGRWSSPWARARTVIVLLMVVYHLAPLSAASKELQTPVFLEPISDVKVPAGRDVRLACVVDHLGPYKLAWILQDRSAILTVGSHVITRNPRISVTHDGHRTWYLSIKNVRPGDAGAYMCQVNTEVVTSQVGHVSVVVPPSIKDDMSSRDVRVTEGSDVTLACGARGSPVPTIKWRREDNNQIQINKTLSMNDVPGPLLQLNRVSRTDMGAYLCIASNGVPPTVSKRIKVEVKFVPTVYVPHQLVGLPLGQNVTIECFIESFPRGLNYWKRPNGIEILHSDNKYQLRCTEGKPDYKTHMTLTIRSVTVDDIGEYNCIANNSQGGAEQVVRVSASMPLSNNHNTINKGYNNKEGSYEKSSLSSVSWGKDTDYSNKIDFSSEKLPSRPADHRNPLQRQQHRNLGLEDKSSGIRKGGPGRHNSDGEVATGGGVGARTACGCLWITWWFLCCSLILATMANSGL